MIGKSKKILKTERMNAMKKQKRWISALLCILLCVGMLPTIAFAADMHTVTYQLTGMTADGGPVQIEHETGLSVRLTTMTGYKTPNDISVTVGGKELTRGDNFSATNYGDWIALDIPTPYVTGDIVITAEATKLTLSSEADLASLEYYDGGLWDYIMLTDEQLQQAASPEGVTIAMSHGCLDNQMVIILTKTENSAATADYDDWAQLKNGECTVVVTVTAEDGTKKDYTLHFYIDETHD